jgi:hypothetical protein
MIFEYIKNSEIDRNLWDKCIKNSYNAKVYGMSWYLDNICDTWDAIIDLDYQAVLALPIKNKYGFNYIPITNYLQINGIFSKIELSESEVTEIISRIPSKFVSVEININSEINLDNPDLDIELKQNNYLSLNNSYIDIYNNFSKVHKKNIKKSESQNLNLILDKDIQSVLKMKKQVWDRNSLPFTERKLVELETLLINAQEKNETNVYKVTCQEEICAAAFFLKFNNRFHLYSGTSEKGRETGAMYFIMNQFIKDNANTDSILDFSGSSIKNISDWNIGFGAITENYSSIKSKKDIYKLLESLKMFVKR